MELYRQARKWSQIGPQMIPGPEMIRRLDLTGKIGLISN